MKLLIFISLIFISIPSFAQFGTSVYYQDFKAENWQNIIGSGENFHNGLATGIFFSLKLKKPRIEFVPEFTLGKFNHKMTLNNQDFLLSNSFYEFTLNTNFYPFNWEGDCNCPTWGKKGPEFDKGFFFQLNFGYLYAAQSINEIKSTASNFFLGAGIGLDLGFTDLFTLTPILKYKYHLETNWDKLNYSLYGLNAEEQSTKNPFSKLEIGLILTLNIFK